MNRNEVAYFADVIKQVLAPQHTALLWSLLLLTVTPNHHTMVKSSDGLTDRNDREDQLRRLAFLATELSSHDDYYQHVHYGNTARRTNETTNSNSS